MTTRQTLYFARPYKTEIRSEPIPAPSSHQVLVKTVLSAISAGTEMLFFRGQVPSGMSADASIAGMGNAVQYPISYGYCCVGEVVEIGSSVDSAWHGRRVFAFHPHSSHFVADTSALLSIPENLSFEQAVFLPNMETATNFLMDARPIVGERVLIMGLGVVGLLTTFLLHKFPIGEIAAIDGYANRRALAVSWDIHSLFSPDEVEKLRHFDPDLILEVSSNPSALAAAIELAGYGTRIVVGSWYGDKIAQLPLGGSFHRNRIQIISSQVSTLDGQFSNRWTKARRLQTAWQHLTSFPAESLITHRLSLAEAAYAYDMLDKQPDQVIQIVFTYS